MKGLLVGLIVVWTCQVIAQEGGDEEARGLYEESLKAIEARNYKQAIDVMDEFIRRFPEFENIHMIYLNRAGAKAMQKDLAGAIHDYNLALEHDSLYYEGYRQRGYFKKDNGDLDGAIADYDRAIAVDPVQGQAYVNKGFAQEDKGLIDSACANYSRGLARGAVNVAGKFYTSCDSTLAAIEKYAYKILVDKATDETYGYTKENAIKCGHGPEGQRAYLGLLRDARGNRVKFKRTGSAGSYPSKNGMFGMAMLDAYEVTYKNEKGRKKKVTLYISFYDYEQPKIPVGFYSVRDFENK